MSDCVGEAAKCVLDGAEKADAIEIVDTETLATAIDMVAGIAVMRFAFEAFANSGNVDPEKGAKIVKDTIRIAIVAQKLVMRKCLEYAERTLRETNR